MIGRIEMNDNISNHPAHPAPEGARVYTVVGEDREMGRSSIDIRCPFCNAVVTAYIWSLAGHGKKCTCGAMHSYYGFTTPPKEKKKG